MKKKYLVPKIEVVKMNVNHFLCYSGGLDSRQDGDYNWEEE